MLIDDAIKQLQEAKKDGVKSIVLAWWGADEFDEKDDEEWTKATLYVEDQMDWANTAADLQCQLDDYKEDPDCLARRQEWMNEILGGINESKKSTE